MFVFACGLLICFDDERIFREVLFSKDCSMVVAREGQEGEDGWRVGGEL